MNKAFVREPEDTGERKCPHCGSLGMAVERNTIAAHVHPGAESGLAPTAFFCPFARCEVVYFDMFDRVLLTSAAAEPIYPKDPDAPICGCFGLTAEDVAADIDEGGVQRVRSLLEKSKSPEANCLIRSPNGRCCMPEVQKYYMKLRSGAMH